MPRIHAERFSKHEGWDFHRPKDRKKFIKRLSEEQPDEILLSPVCHLWSPMYETSMSMHPERRAKLIEDSRRDHDEVLMFCAVVYEIQRKNGRHAHLIHPWETRPWENRGHSPSSVAKPCMWTSASTGCRFKMRAAVYCPLNAHMCDVNQACRG